MATYRGAEYVGEQIISILDDLSADDELIIIDDASPDDTAQSVRAIEDPRISFIARTENRGYVRTFEEAALLSRGEYIFLSDQDDLWIPGRVDRMIEALQRADLVASNFEVFGSAAVEPGKKLRAVDSKRHIRNIFGIMIGYRPYYGCAMAFRRKFAEFVVPMPGFLFESHDLWLALSGNVFGSITHLEEATLRRRIHGENVTPQGWRSLRSIIRARWMLLRCLLLALSRRVRA